MPTVNFKVSVKSRGLNFPESLQERLADFSPAFENIIEGWIEHNEDKFKEAKGAETSGVDMAADVHWEALTPDYFLRKHGGVKSTDRIPNKKRVSKGRTLYPDWLMVATGDLMAAMTDPTAIYQAIAAQTVVFGMPTDEEDAVKVQGNWKKRPVIFLDLTDMRMIKENIQDYLNYGEDYKEAREAIAAAKYWNSDMDQDFSETIRE
jgi:hypothetical protein